MQKNISKECNNIEESIKYDAKMLEDTNEQEQNGLMMNVENL